MAPNSPTCRHAASASTLDYYVVAQQLVDDSVGPPPDAHVLTGAPLTPHELVQVQISGVPKVVKYRSLQRSRAFPPKRMQGELPLVGPAHYTADYQWSWLQGTNPARRMSLGDAWRQWIGHNRKSVV